MSNFREVKDSINVRVANNTAFNQNVNLLGSTADPLGVPPHLLYQWDLSTETYFGSVTATIVVSNISNPTPVTYTVQVNGYNIQSVAFALNSLNIGLFQVSGNIIYVSNDYYIYGALSVGSNVFISTWDTTLTSGTSSASNQIQLPLVSAGVYDFIVDWGDGSQDTITAWNQSETLHTYSVSGVYTLQLVGTIIDISFGTAPVSDNEKILSISAWGTLQFGVNANQSFLECFNLDLTAVSDIPNLSLSTDFSYCFSFYNYTTINRINEWDVSNIVNMTAMFEVATSFNQPLNNWNTSQVTNMLNMFGNTNSFNQPLDSWDTSQVTIMSGMFGASNVFNQPLNSWDISQVTQMGGMFANAIAFNQSLNSWDTSQVINMSFMFSGAISFNQSLNLWNTSNVTNMGSMFSDATAFNQDISSWDVSNVTNITLFMLNKTPANYSTTNLDAIYNSWSLLTVQPNLTVNFGTIKYTLAGQAGKNILLGAPQNWTITDGGI